MGGKKAKTCLSSLTLNFKCLFTFNLVSFHASSRLIKLNLLHAEVSYIINIACHWIFFSNISSFSYFLDGQNPDFFPFSESLFLCNVLIELTFTNAAT